ncbi:hypothetical protein TRFO_26450 [Tritrichomonas foetus]|uniref:Uncharacterized protein n=1 Tax=Tritrichomonas foetus TaxID=1144522 RepID=A0A1J4K4J3_9EUKA|nr:hypothetical protein TRFO_26450 [Tritrichomonas foetus]|eukprot:OHT05768.1 hypothetical protein TRFO_26450 [Tritrichomonas foetus]
MNVNDSPEMSLIYPSPLSVCFHCWEDQCCPLLRFSCFVSIKWNNYYSEKSRAWSDSFISSVLFAGTNSGTIVVYKIYAQNGANPSIKPLSLIFGHRSKITSLVPCDPFIYRSCVASLSTDGTLSLISVEDLTIIKNIEALFSENSHDLAPHESNNRLMLASQAFGTVEVADISNNSLVLRISGFSSVISSIENHGTLHAVSCADGSIGVFSINPSGSECIYHIKQRDKPFSHSILSPKLSYLLVMTSDEWSLYDSDELLFSEKIQSPDDCFISAKWVDEYMFYITTLSGRVEVWKTDSENETQIFDRMKTFPGVFYASSLAENKAIEPLIIQDLPTDTKKIHSLPLLTFAVDSPADCFSNAVTVTPEGFVISSPRP